MKKIFNRAVISIMIICIIMSMMISAFAHPQMLNVQYDECIADPSGDGINEKWYILNSTDLTQHYNHEIATIKYYFESTAENDSTYTWTTDMTIEQANELKEGFANSLKKWNNVYFYSHGSSGNIVKNKIINVVEGTETDHNLSIYPEDGNASFARFESTEGIVTVETQNGINHKHFSKAKMTVFPENFLTSDERLYYLYEQVGAHELGHALGLCDAYIVDLCGAANSTCHHQELLMGTDYNSIMNRCNNITYKDISGVAIARGFHTDSDHKWLNAGQQSDGTYKLICSICNGVKYFSSLNGYTFNSYGQCNGNHNLIDGNMMAVASYGTKDYFKCKYCRYVAPFDDLVEQQYSYSRFGTERHRCISEVVGLEYFFSELHTMENEMCTKCGYHIHLYTDHYQQYTDTNHLQYCRCGDFLVEPHSYTHHYQKYNSASHIAYCDCGDSIITAHVLMRPVGGSIGGLSICKYCGAQVSFGVLDSIPSDYPHTENGSYILPSGIIVLAPEDEEAYLNGTLEFRTGEVM